jgi:hypothetical protein
VVLLELSRTMESQRTQKNRPNQTEFIISISSPTLKLIKLYKKNKNV